MCAVLARLPAPEGVVARLLMLHDPGMFRFVPDGRFDLTLSGHTHGGQVGLLTFGLPITFVSAISSIPDHGPWQMGRSLLYVHRGTGHYGFPIRVGVPSEDSVLDVIIPESRRVLAAAVARP
jgi:predicted MPP superfamily phosphohydrolase